MVVFRPIAGATTKVSVTDSSSDTALSTSGTPNCVLVQSDAGSDECFIRIGASGGTAVVDTRPTYSCRTTVLFAD